MTKGKLPLRQWVSDILNKIDKHILIKDKMFKPEGRDTLERHFGSSNLALILNHFCSVVIIWAVVSCIWECFPVSFIGQLISRNHGINDVNPLFILRLCLCSNSSYQKGLFALWNKILIPFLFCSSLLFWFFSKCSLQCWIHSMTALEPLFIKKIIKHDFLHLPYLRQL